MVFIGCFGQLALIDVCRRAKSRLFVSRFFSDKQRQEYALHAIRHGQSAAVLSALNDFPVTDEIWDEIAQLCFSSWRDFNALPTELSSHLVLLTQPCNRDRATAFAHAFIKAFVPAAELSLPDQCMHFLSCFVDHVTPEIAASLQPTSTMFFRLSGRLPPLLTSHQILRACVFLCSPVLNNRQLKASAHAFMETCASIDLLIATIAHATTLAEHGDFSQCKWWVMRTLFSVCFQHTDSDQFDISTASKLLASLITNTTNVKDEVLPDISHICLVLCKLHKGTSYTSVVGQLSDAQLKAFNKSGEGKVFLSFINSESRTLLITLG